VTIPDRHVSLIARPPAWPYRLGFAALFALMLWVVLWEALLAPLRPGSAWLALKALPLAFLLPGVARGARRARQWLALLLPFYFAEGLVRALTEHGRHAGCAALAALLAAIAFGALLRGFRDEKLVASACDGL
jgi:uncharacterized membrane protein